MGPQCQLEYDNSENLPAKIGPDQTIPDPFPWKAFSENLKRIALHTVWNGNYPWKEMMTSGFVRGLTCQEV
ncbi:hypothetical protein F4677DRAFT_99660 [Hypoxylon crocopeplum]|nr:hypothetical protein F4677DRAFT_99660 [Hypoxylon crocopeplum]